MKKMLFKTVLLFILSITLPDTVKACTCQWSPNLCAYLSFYPQSSFFRVRIDTIDNNNTPPSPFPEYGITVIEQYNGLLSLSPYCWLTGRDMGSCAGNFPPDAQVGDTFLISILERTPDTASLWTCSYMQKIKKDTICYDQACFHINDLQDTIDACLQRNVGTKNIDLFSSIQVYPNPVREMLNINNESGAMVLSVQLSDITGRKVLFHEGKNLNALPIGPINSGLYFIQIRTDKGIITRKINIEK